MYSASAADTRGWAISPGQHKVKSFKIEHCHFILFSHAVYNTKILLYALTDAAQQLALYIIFTLSGLIIIFASCLSGSITTRSSCSVILVIISFMDKKKRETEPSILITQILCHGRAGTSFALQKLHPTTDTYIGSVGEDRISTLKDEKKKKENLSGISATSGCSLM